MTTTSTVASYGAAASRTERSPVHLTKVTVDDGERVLPCRESPTRSAHQVKGRDRRGQRHRETYDASADGQRSHRGRRPRGGQSVLRQTRHEAGRRGDERGPLGGPGRRA